MNTDKNNVLPFCRPARSSSHSSPVLVQTAVAENLDGPESLGSEAADYYVDQLGMFYLYFLKTGRHQTAKVLKDKLMICLQAGTDRATIPGSLVKEMQGLKLMPVLQTIRD